MYILSLIQLVILVGLSRKCRGYVPFERLSNLTLCFHANHWKSLRHKINSFLGPYPRQVSYFTVVITPLHIKGLINLQAKHSCLVCHCVQGSITHELFMIICVLSSTQSIHEQEEMMARTMTNVLQIVNSVFSTAIKAAYPGFTPMKGTVQGSGGKFGDYKCLAAMPIAQVCRTQQCVWLRVCLVWVITCTQKSNCRGLYRGREGGGGGRGGDMPPPKLCPPSAKFPTIHT